MSKRFLTDSFKSPPGSSFGCVPKFLVGTATPCLGRTGTGTLLQTASGWPQSEFRVPLLEFDVGFDGCRWKFGHWHSMVLVGDEFF